jgi:hypothetical protein
MDRLVDANYKKSIKNLDAEIKRISAAKKEIESRLINLQTEKEKYVRLKKQTSKVIADSNDFNALRDCHAKLLRGDEC